MLRKTLTRWLRPLRVLHTDERGDNENLGRLLLLGLVLVPLILLLAFFGGEIYDEAEKQWNCVMDEDLSSATSGVTDC